MVGPSASHRTGQSIVPGVPTNSIESKRPNQNADYMLSVVDGEVWGKVWTIRVSRTPDFIGFSDAITDEIGYLYLIPRKWGSKCPDGFVQGVLSERDMCSLRNAGRPTRMPILSRLPWRSSRTLEILVDLAGKLFRSVGDPHARARCQADLNNP